MPYDLFQERPDGAFDFTDSATGQTIALPPTPAVRARVAALGAAAGGVAPPPGTVDVQGPAGEPLRLAQAAPPAPMSAPLPDPVSRAEWTTAPDPAPAGVSQPEPLMSVAPPAPPAAPAGPRVDPGKVRMAQPQGGGFSGPAGAGSFQAPNMTELSEAEGLEVGLRRQKMMQAARGSYTPSSPEREQRVSVNRERRLGPDPDIVREMEAIETGAVPFRLPDELRKPLPTITTSEVKDLFQPPPGKNGKPLNGKELDAWAQSVATDAQEKGYSPGTLATMLPARAGTPPKHAPGEVLDAWEKEQAAAHAAKVAAADKRSVDVRSRYDALVGSIVTGEQAKADDWVRRFGTYGMAGAEMRNAAIEKGLQQDAADAEVQRAGYTDAYARQREAVLLRQRDKLAAIETQTKDLDAKLAKGIDPDRFWRSKNTSEQVGLAIAMALGAIGSQMAKGPNYAQDAINASVQRDLEAQREELANGRQAKSDMQLAYKQVMDLTGSEMAATAAMEHAAYQGIEHDLQRKLALAKSERAEIQGNTLLAKIRKDQLQRQAVISEAARGSESTASRVIPAQRGGYSGPNLDKMIEQAKAIREIAGSGAKLRGDVQADVAKAAKDATGGHLPERVVFGGSTYQMENVTSPAEGAKARDAMRALDTMASLRQKMAEEAKSYGTRLWNPGKFAQYAEAYKYQESKATEQGVVRDPEMERHLSNVGSFRGGPDVIKALESSELSMRENALRQWGAVPVGKRLCPTRRRPRPSRWPRRTARSSPFRLRRRATSTSPASSVSSMANRSRSQSVARRNSFRRTKRGARSRRVSPRASRAPPRRNARSGSTISAGSGAPSPRQASRPGISFCSARGKGSSPISWIRTSGRRRTRRRRRIFATSRKRTRLRPGSAAQPVSCFRSSRPEVPRRGPAGSRAGLPPGRQRPWRVRALARSRARKRCPLQLEREVSSGPGSTQRRRCPAEWARSATSPVGLPSAGRSLSGRARAGRSRRSRARLRRARRRCRSTR